MQEAEREATVHSSEALRTEVQVCVLARSPVPAPRRPNTRSPQRLRVALRTCQDELCVEREARERAEHEADVSVVQQRSRQTQEAEIAREEAERAQKVGGGRSRLLLRGWELADRPAARAGGN